MVDLETKNKLLKELEKTGNVYISCARVGIDRSTYYEWLKSEKEFGKKMREAIKRGREGNCDIAEYALMKNAKEGKMDAIKYVLGHQSKIYKPKDRKVFLVHSNKNESEKAIEIRKKERRRIYCAGYTDSMKSYTENLREEFKHINSEEEMDNRIEEVRDGTAEGLYEELMEEAGKHYDEQNGNVH